MEISVDFVICGECGGKFKEINNNHLKKHNLTAAEYDLKHKPLSRISQKTRKNKNGFKTLTKEISDKLKFSHTIEGYIEKYGEEIGRIKYQKMKDKKSHFHTIEGYIEKYGEEIGRIKYNESNKKRSRNLEWFVEKFGNDEGNKKYKEFCAFRKETTSLQYYIKKYGEAAGLEKWLLKNYRISKANKRIEENKIEHYLKYKEQVDKYSRLSLNKFYVDNLELRSKEFHLDHKVSICYGFINDIDPKIIGSIYNLEIIPRSENCSKQEKCSILPEDLINMVDQDNFYKDLNI